MDKSKTPLTRPASEASESSSAQASPVPRPPRHCRHPNPTPSSAAPPSALERCDIDNMNTHLLDMAFVSPLPIQYPHRPPPPSSPSSRSPIGYRTFRQRPRQTRVTTLDSISGEREATTRLLSARQCVRKPTSKRLPEITDQSEIMPADMSLASPTHSKKKLDDTTLAVTVTQGTHRISIAMPSERTLIPPFPKKPLRAS
ncbi:hypothetical protein OG21DRAFT_1501887 [Imleria badia]|nr:hypothetical protein OG21DRAFT_1501887 [Imleria badia]